MRSLLLLMILLLPGAAIAQSSEPFFATSNEAQPNFLPVEKAFSFEQSRLADGRVRLHWRISPGYYLYRDRLSIEGAATKPELPEGQSHSDANFGRSSIYRNDLEITLPDSTPSTLKLTWQGCADAGLCYPPQHATVTLDGGSNQVDSAPRVLAADEGLAAQIQQSGMLYSVLLFFSLGLLLAFTPCSLPMLPILASLVVGSEAKAWRSTVLAACFVTSMALVYAAMGTIAAVLGTNLQIWLQQPWLIGSFAALFVVLALPMFGVFELQLPSTLRQKLDAKGQQHRGGSIGGAAALGIISGLLVGPCMTAPLAGALLYIAQSKDVLLGSTVLFALGLGMGLPLILITAFGQRWLPRPGAWMNAIKILFGFFLLAGAWLVIRPILDPTTWVALGGALLTIFGWSATKGSAALPKWGYAVGASGAVAALWGAAMLVGAAGGTGNPLQPLQVFTAAHAASPPISNDFVTISTPEELDAQLNDAQAHRQWAVLDFSADWCVSCKVIEREIFDQPNVKDALNGTRLLRVDVTNDGPASRNLLDRYRVPGPPSILWINPDGHEVREHRITGEITQQQFLDHWHQARPTD